MIGDPTTAYNINILRKYLMKAKNTDDLEIIKKYVCDYFGHCSSSPGVLMWHPFLQDFKHYSKKDTMDLFFPIKMHKTSVGDSIRVYDKKANGMVRFCVTHWFFNINKVTYYENYHPAKPRVYEEEDGTKFINRFAGFIHKNPRPFKEYAIEVYTRVFFILKHIEDVLFSGKQDQYYYFINWLARVISGIRMKTAIYLYSEEHGTGKTILTDFLRKKVLGDHITHLTGSTKLILGDFNIELRGKILLLLEEMPAINKGDWNAFANRMKYFIDTDTIQLQEKFKNPISVKHTASLMLNSNSKVVRLEKSDRRYFIPDIANKRSLDYYKDLADAMEYPEVGEAFYSYMLEIVKLNPEFDPRKIPTSKMKQGMMQIHSEKDGFIEFLKVQFLSEHAKYKSNSDAKNEPNSKVSSSKSYGDYKEFLKNTYWNKKLPGIQEFTKKMGGLGFTSSIQRLGGKRLRCYNLSYDKVYEALDKKGLLHPEENIEEPENYKASEEDQVTESPVLKCPEMENKESDASTKTPPPLPKPKHLQLRKKDEEKKENIKNKEHVENNNDSWAEDLCKNEGQPESPDKTDNSNEIADNDNNKVELDYDNILTEMGLC